MKAHASALATAQPIERMVVMRDGVRLATDIYLPHGHSLDDGPGCPVILERTPYGKRELYRTERSAEVAQPLPREAIAGYFNAHGYALVYQDCRGRFASEGRFTKYVGEAEDGYDTMAWLVEQPFCDGRIGTMGLSYAAHTQAAVACLNPPGLRCMLLDSGGFSNAYRGAIRQGGALELKQAVWAWKHARLSPQAQNNPEIAKTLDAENIFEWFRPERMPWTEQASPIQAVPDYQDYLFEQWRRGSFDDYWSQIGLYAEGHYANFPNLPILHISSWYDPYTRCAMRNYSGLNKLHKGPNELVLGPWLHGQRSITHAGDIDFGSAATLDGQLAHDYLEFRLRWFDRHLRPQANPGKTPRKAPEHPVRYFLMGGGSGRKNAAGRLAHGGRWVACSDWPPPHIQPRRFYLHGNGELNTELPVANAPPLAYRYDPMNPVPTIGGAVTSGSPIMEGGGFDQVETEGFFGVHTPGRSLAERADVLVFCTSPLAADTELSGELVADLWVSSDCPDTDFTVKLIDWYPPSPDYPNGYALNLCDGILRLRYREDWRQPKLLEPNVPVRARIEPFAFSNLFRSGHRIRIDISSSNYPRFDLNPNTGEPEGLWTRAQTALNKVFVDAERPSQITLPFCLR